MSYDIEIAPLLKWVMDHPGLTRTGLERSIKAIPWPTRMETPSIPSISEIKWKLRYLELRGDVWQEKRKWYATNTMKRVP